MPQASSDAENFLSAPPLAVSELLLWVTSSAVPGIEADWTYSLSGWSSQFAQGDRQDNRRSQHKVVQKESEEERTWTQCLGPPREIQESFS